MPYNFNTPADQEAMLAAIGAGSVEELFHTIPAENRLDRPLDIPPAMGEMELTRWMNQLADQNLSVQNSTCFLGGGAYDHFIPAVVDALASRGEFYTSYTPYQPEVAQGNLQAMFEYQTLICRLTGMDVSNASLYDGGSAAAEAVLMSMSVTRRSGKIVVAESVHPEYRAILRTFLANLGVELVVVPAPQGRVEMDELAAAVDADTAGVLVQSPNFFGCLEELPQAADIAHQHGALLVASFDPISLGLLKNLGEQGVDIAVAEGQCLGNPLSFGGPYLGIMACREKFVRRMPGRIAGETVDRRGRRCWVLTLQTREQHIRREKATSNICTNQGLFALRSRDLPVGRRAAGGCATRPNSACRRPAMPRRRLAAHDRFEPAFPSGATFKEFVVRDREGSRRRTVGLRGRQGVLAGLPLGRWYPELADCFLIAVTEQRTRGEIDAWVDVLMPLQLSGTGN